MKGFTCCGDCIYYNYKKHKCNLGASIETDAREPFYDDCPIPDIPSEKEIRNNTIEEFIERLGKVSEVVRPVGWSTKQEIVLFRSIMEIAEQMKEVGE